MVIRRRRTVLASMMTGGGPLDCQAIGRREVVLERPPSHMRIEYTHGWTGARMECYKTYSDQGVARSPRYTHSVALVDSYMHLTPA